MTDRTKKSILIIDHEAPLTEALTFAFADQGYTVWSADNGDDGLAMALQYQPDMILLNIILPKMDGLTMLEKLRQNMWGKTAPVMVLTNLSDMGHTKKAIEHHVHDVLIKSDWKIEDVVNKVHHKLVRD